MKRSKLATALSIDGATALLFGMFGLMIMGGGCFKPQKVLTIAVEGAGTTLPTPSRHTYDKDTFVQLQVVPDKNSAFSHWAGKDGGFVTDDNRIFMNQDRSITAIFTTLTHPLNINISPAMSGYVNVDLVSDDGKYNIQHGQTVRLTAIPNREDTYFVNWSGDLTGMDNPVELLITSEKNITAHFATAMLAITDEPEVIRAGQAFNMAITIKAGERPIPDIVIKLTEKKGQPFQGDKTAQTDADGVAVFKNLMFYEGVYNLTFSTVKLGSIKKDFAVDVAGVGTAADPYQINNFYGLEFIHQHLDACFRIERDIDASATAAASYNGGKGWLPLGQSTVTSFKGQIDGNNKTISNLYINRPDEEYVGFIGYIQTAVHIQNLNLTNVDITGKTRVGGLVGAIKDATASLVENCSVTGVVRGNLFTGGMFGRLSGTVRDCHTDTTVEVILVDGSAFNHGGLAGTVAEATVANCYAVGNVIGDYTFGGLFGNAYDSTISHCYALGDLECHRLSTVNKEIGGFVGHISNGCLITDCFSRGDVDGRRELGGFCGYLIRSTIERCYSTGSVTNPSPLANCGGFIGYSSGLAEAIITNCYYDVDTSGCSDTGKGEPMTTAEMQNAESYNEWSFGLVWHISQSVNDGYPYLVNTPIE
jgi:hypothetical protein